MTTIVSTNGEIRTPTGLKVKAQSYASIEKAANTLRPSLPLMGSEPFRLDCLSIFERTLPAAGYAYRTVAIDEMHDCAGFTIPERNVVVLREDVYEKLHADQVYGRSTVIHELSHLALRHHVTLHRGAVAGEHEFYEDSEWQAKALTAALMMPLDAARIAATPRHLAEMCGTSEMSARYRIATLVKNLKLLTPSHSLWEYGMDK